MKRLISLVAAIALAAAPLAAEKTWRLNDGIAGIAKGIAAKVPADTKVIVVDIKSDTPDAGAYVAEELTYQLLQTERLVVVDRDSLDQIRREQAFQNSGDVSDDSAQRLGAMLGAETIITGSFDLVADRYRLSVKAVKVETAQIQYLATRSITADAETAGLFGQKTGAAKVAESTGKAVRAVADFTGRLICSVINPAAGIGSFIQGDTGGGMTVLFWEGVGAGSLIMAGNTTDPDEEMLWTAVGALSLGGGVIYAIVRPWSYNRHPYVAAVLDNVHIAMPAADSLRVGYTVRY